MTDVEPVEAVHERLTALDTSFLRMESATTPMHMGLLCVIDGRALLDEEGSLDLEALGVFVGRRLAGVERLTQRVQEVPLSLGRPVWVDDPDFDATRHVTVSTLPAPGGRSQLEEHCEGLQMQLLDRSRPLFEMHLVDGLDPDEFGPGAFALVQKVHHALLDGMSGVELLAALFDVEPERGGGDPEPVAGRADSAPVDRWRLMGEAVADLAREPATLVRQITAAVVSPLATARHLAAMAGAGGDFMSTRSTATSSLNRTVGASRRLTSISVPLTRVHDTGIGLGGTVNDVVLSAVALGLRSLFDHRHESVDGAMKALVPVSTRRTGLDAEHGNHVAALVVELPVDTAEPAAVFAEVSARVHQLKQQHHADGTEYLIDVGNHVPSAVLDFLTRLVGDQHVFNLVVTNLPGPPVPLYLDGALVRELVPIVPLGGNLTLGVAVLSYDGDVVLAFHADGEACPDVEVMARAVREGFDGLAAAAGVE
ncbi:MAG: wax ester/triacylglycerol synthase family O-acyltransferase [Acidimicrobiales bacterium]